MDRGAEHGVCHNNVTWNTDVHEVSRTRYADAVDKKPIDKMRKSYHLSHVELLKKVIIIIIIASHEDEMNDKYNDK